MVSGPSCKIKMNEKEQEALIAFTQGMDIPDIAEEICVSISTVYRWLKTANIVEKITTGRDEAIIEIYTTTKIPAVEILKQFEISQSTLYNILRKYNVPLRRQKSNKEKLSDTEIIDMYQNGDPIRLILSKSGRSLGYIYKILDARNIRLRRRVFLT